MVSHHSSRWNGSYLTRRYMLGSIGAAAIAGCIGDDQTPNEDDEEIDPENGSESENGTEDDSDTGGTEPSDDDGIEPPENLYTGPSGDEPEPVQVVGNWLLTVNENDADGYNSYLHSAYAWPEADPEDLEGQFYLDDLTIELIDEDLTQEEIEDLRLFSSATSASQSDILEAADGTDTAVVETEGSTIDDGEELFSMGEYLLIEEGGEWKVAL